MSDNSALITLLFSKFDWLTQPIIIAGIIVVAIAVAIILLICYYQLKKHSEIIDNTIFESITNLDSNVCNKRESLNLEEVRKGLLEQSNTFYDDIENYIENKYYNEYIQSSIEEHITFKLKDAYYEAFSLKKKLEIFQITPSERLIKFINDYGSIHTIIQGHNQRIIGFLLKENQNFFDHCLKYPLDEQQRRSIVSEEENCLVVSSAGSGKTSSIVGKVKYLIERKNINPNRILLISYTNKAAAELTERVGDARLRGYTFHKLALDIIGKETGQKPNICDNTDTLFVKIYHDLLSDKNFQKAIIEYFIDYQVQEEEWEKQKQEHRQNLQELKKTRLKALLPDMDGNIIYVRSEQEQRICFVLSSLGVKFRYEEPYEYPLMDDRHSQYKPDFSIYYEKNGKLQRVYLEHYAIDEHGLVPLWFAKDRGITYEEANKQYGDGIAWKKAAHEKFGTTLISTSSADFNYFDIKQKIQTLLNDVGVPTEQKTEDELYDMVLPKDSKQEKAFIRLVVTFITLLKSSCKSISDIQSGISEKRSNFIIRSIFIPVYERYNEALKQNNQIDFTDAILWATKLCESNKSVSYDYIIVDEFQDISIDRYNFLRSLRNGNPPAKLYCVGDDWQSIYRFSGSDMSLFNHFDDYFGATDVNKIETTYRFGEPIVSLSSDFIQRNKSQVSKDIHPFNKQARTDLVFQAYERQNYSEEITKIISSIPQDKSIFLLGRYSFDDYYLSFTYQSIKEGAKFFYIIAGRKIEFLTVHKSKGLEADYVIILQCNKDIYGFPSMISDDPVLKYVLTKDDQYPFGEERRLFYVAITRAKIKTIVLYDQRFPSVFVNEFLHPENITEYGYNIHPNANKKWTRGEDKYLLILYRSGKSIKYISNKMGRSQTSIIMRLGKHGVQ